VVDRAGQGRAGRNAPGGGEPGHRNFHAPPPWPSPGEEIALSAGESRHAHRAARVAVGESIRLVDGEGREAGAQVVRAIRGRLVVRLAAIREIERSVDRPWELALPRLRAPARTDWAVEKATELGCRAFHVYAAGRSLKGAGAPREARAERWRSLALAAMKQSGRTWWPPVSAHASLAALCAAWAARAQPGGARGAGERRGRVLHGDERGAAIGALAPFAPGERLLLVVGPEGGFTDEEQAELARRGSEAVRLGPHRLRSESAAVALAVLVAAGRD